RSRTEEIWKIFDAIGQGNVKESLVILTRLFDQGEEPIRLLGAFGYQLRRLAQALQLHQAGVPVLAALEKVGVMSFKVKNAEQQMRHLGRRRLEKLYDWLLQADMDVKGGSVLPPRTILERLVVRLARKND